MALISDAGMPGISDPGAAVIAAAAAAGVPVFPVPGPCAAVCGLVGSGLPTESFLFAGFLPPKQAARRAQLRRLRPQRATLVFYAPPHGLAAVLADAVAVLGGGRRCCVARELTKLHEEFARRAAALRARARDKRTHRRMRLVGRAGLAQRACLCKAHQPAAARRTFYDPPSRPPPAPARRPLPTPQGDAV